MSSVGAIFLSIPFYFLWNYWLPIYALQLSPQYQPIPFWYCIELFALVVIIRMLLFSPRFFGMETHLSARWL
jgi:hypothetical protein